MLPPVATMLSGPVATPPPIPTRPPRRDGDMDWEEALDRHRDRLSRERAARAEPWNVASLEAAVAATVSRLLTLQEPMLDLLDEGRIGEDDPVRACARVFTGTTLETGLDGPIEWIAEAAPPRLDAPPALRDARALRRRWEDAQSRTAKPVKLSLLGPRSFAGLIDDAVHGTNVDAGARAFAEALNPGLRALGDAGCPAVELVEPALLGDTPAATPGGFEAVARALHRVPRATQRWLRLVPADGRPPWLGEPPPARPLDRVADLLADLPIDGVILQPASVLSAMDVLERWQHLRVALLVVPGDAGGEFTVDDAAAPLQQVASRLPPERLVAAVDGGGAAARLPLATRLDLLTAARRALQG